MDVFQENYPKNTARIPSPSLIILPNSTDGISYTKIKKQWK
jgi:hypothetical protein